MSEQEEKLEQLTGEITKALGKGAFCSAADVLGDEKQVISVGPALDFGLSGGIPEGSWVSVTGPPKAGKALLDESLVWTPQGQKRLDEIVVGDLVAHPAGGFTEVTGVYPQGVIPISRVRFKDGVEVFASDDHLWSVRRRHDYGDLVLTTKQVAEGMAKDGKGSRWSIPLTQPVPAFRADADRPVHPYLLGVLLGNGCLRNRSTVRLSTADREMVDRSNACLATGSRLKKIGGTACDWSVRPIGELARHLKRLGLHGLLSKQKFIPEAYLYGPPDVRLAVLQGLMDTDGSVDKKGQCEVTFASEKLARDVAWLVKSIGGVAPVRFKRATLNGEVFPAWRCTPRLNDNRLLFRLERKKQRCGTRSKRPLRLGISSISPAGVASCRCITVSAPDGLFLTGPDLVVTHNSTTALACAARAQLPEHGGRVVVYADVEGRLKKKNLLGIQGLDLSPEKFRIIRSTTDKILTMEDFLGEMSRVLTTLPKVFLIIDSVSALVTEHEMTAGMDAPADRGRGNQTVRKFCATNANVVPVMKSVVLGITHQYFNTSGMGPQKNERAAQAWKYQSDIRLRLDWGERWTVGATKEGKGGRQIGIKAHWTVEESALGAPGATVTSYLRFGTGIDRVYEVLDFGMAAKLIGKNGSWLTLDYMQNHLDLLGVEKWNAKAEQMCKAQGGERLYKLLKDNPTWCEALMTDLRAITCGTEGEE